MTVEANTIKECMAQEKLTVRREKDIVGLTFLTGSPSAVAKFFHMRKEEVLALVEKYHPKEVVKWRRH